MADMQSPEHPLEVLPAMLNLVLLQTAKILRDPECHNLKQAGLTRRRITEIVTVANQRFHDALDEIEVEVLRAKAVMERDLRLVRKQRAERDRANGLTADPSPLKETDEAVSSDPADLTTAALPNIADKNLEELDVAEKPFSESAPEQSQDADVTVTNIMSQDAITNEQGMPQDSENSVGLAITIPSDDIPEPSEQPKTPEHPAEANTVPEAPIEISDAIDLDFESMFNDTDPKAIDDALNFDFDFSTDSAMAEDILMDSGFNDSNINNTNTANIPATSNEDIDSLLPGVENYLNAETDFSNITMPTTTTLPNTSQPAAASATQAPLQESTEPVMAETSFDDNFFGLGNFEMEGAGGDELGDGTLGDFEDFDWS